MLAKTATPIRRRAPVTVPANLFAISFGLAGVAGVAGCWRVASGIVGAPTWAAISVSAAACWLLVGAAWTAQLLRRDATIAAELAACGRGDARAALDLATSIRPAPRPGPGPCSRP